MDVKKINKDENVIYSIVNSYMEYISLGYPKDHNVYEIVGNSNEITKLKEKIKSITGPNIPFGFCYKIVSFIPDGILMFGLENTVFKLE